METTSEPPNSPPRPSGSVACPECGRELARRGLAGHRRLSHGLVVRREPSAAPALPVRSLLAPTELDRIETRLARIESLVSALFRDRGSPPELRDGEDAPQDELGAARAEWMRVREEIARVKARAAEVAMPRPSGALTPEQEQARRDAHRELGELSRTQFMLLVRLGEHAPGARGETDFSRLGYY